jgi:hypothetical protein
MPAPYVQPRRLAPLAWGVCLLLAAAGGQAQTAGEVEFARGVGFAQTPGENPPYAGPGHAAQGRRPPHDG